MKSIRCALISQVFLIALFGIAQALEIPVFPGAEGFGTTTPAGRGGRIITVTTLNASGPGSLKEAVNQSGPRTIVFEVGGIIDLRATGSCRYIDIENPYCTIAGQTAPYPGITLIGSGIGIYTHDVLVQHLTIRPGDHTIGSGSCRDCFIFMGNSSEHAENIVVDHCSMSWSTDKIIIAWTRGQPETHDITVSNCIMSEALHCAYLHKEKCHSKGFLIGDFSQRITLKTSLMAHNYDRNPSMKGGSMSQVVNNVVYNPGVVAMVCTGSSFEGDTMVQASIVGNVLKSGIKTALLYDALAGLYLADHPESKFYMHDNLGDSNYWAPLKIYAGHIPDQVSPELFVPTPQEAVWCEPMTVMQSGEVMDYVLANAGSRPAETNDIDARIINEVQTTTGTIIDHIDQVGGWPEYEPTRHELVIPDNPEGDDDADGYTNCEEWLHTLAAELEQPRDLSSLNSRHRKGPTPRQISRAQPITVQGNRIIITPPDLSGPGSVRVYAMSGRLVAARTIGTTHPVMIDNLSAGVYCLKGVFAGKTVQERIKIAY
ncbi:MAG: T9SS type A sorting domain-containing protein [Chitinivibrionales bacterium]|nr:T9SS type A sorting domain-containing protein [Chitinivibrionales bacterium]